MVFHMTFILALFHDKKCCNFINLFPCILQDLIVMSLVLGGEDFIKTVEGCMMSNCWKLKSQCVSLLILRLGQLARCTDSQDFKCDSYTLHPYYIYPNYPQNCKEVVQKKTLERGFYPSCQRELFILKREILIVSSPPLSYCYTLRGDLYSNITYTYSECRECFGAWEALDICQNKPVRLGSAIGQYCKIREVSKDKTSRSSLVVGAWRAQVFWVDQAQRVFLVSLYSNLFTSGLFQLREPRRSFSLSTLVSSLITHLGIILCLHLSSFTLCALH